ncbi:galactoside-binding lectin, partial [Ostertagia ostertagi]
DDDRKIDICANQRVFHEQCLTLNAWNGDNNSKYESAIKGTVPCAIPIRENLRPGSEIVVYGTVSCCSHDNFCVEFLSGPHVVLHVNFRFHDEREVVRHHNPLHPGDRFSLHIRAHQHYYEIEVNGYPLAQYIHRFPMESVQALGLRGHVIVERVHFSGFDFDIDWCGEHDYGHAGYEAYGLDHYEPPMFRDGHAYHRYF